MRWAPPNPPCNSVRHTWCLGCKSGKIFASFGTRAAGNSLQPCFAANQAVAAENFAMAVKRRPEIRERDLKGFKYFRPVEKLLARLHRVGTARDVAGNRELYYDQFVALLLLHFFNPIVSSLRGLQQASGLDKVQKTLGVRRASLGSLSEATGVFPAFYLRSIVQELAGRLPATGTRTGGGSSARLDCRGWHLPAGLATYALGFVDGSSTPRRQNASAFRRFQRRTRRRNDYSRSLLGTPTIARLRFSQGVFTSSIADMPISIVSRYSRCWIFVCRPESKTIRSSKVEDERLSAEAQAAGVVRDVVVSKLGTDHHKDFLKQTVRLIITFVGRNPTVRPSCGWSLTGCNSKRFLIALAYRYRWTVELFFRWFKCILGCRHLLFEDANGVGSTSLHDFDRFAC